MVFKTVASLVFALLLVMLLQLLCSQLFTKFTTGLFPWHIEKFSKCDTWNVRKGSGFSPRLHSSSNECHRKGFNFRDCTYASAALLRLSVWEQMRARICSAKHAWSPNSDTSSSRLLDRAVSPPVRTDSASLNLWTEIIRYVEEEKEMLYKFYWLRLLTLSLEITLLLGTCQHSHFSECTSCLKHFTVKVWTANNLPTFKECQKIDRCPI